MEEREGGYAGGGGDCNSTLGEPLFISPMRSHSKYKIVWRPFFIIADIRILNINEDFFILSMILNFSFCSWLIFCWNKWQSFVANICIVFAM